MRDKVLKSDKYKQARKDGSLNSKELSIVPRKDYTTQDEELHYWLDTMPNASTEEVVNYAEEVLHKAPTDYRLSMSPERIEFYKEFQKRSYMKQFGLTEEDMLMIEALGSEEFSVEAMQERWKQ